MEGATLTSWIAISIGFLHALEPGHGKTALFTYLASGKKNWSEALVISLSSALTHSAAVFLIAFASHFMLHHNSAEESIHELAGILSYISGALVCGLGIWVIIKTKKGENLHNNCCGGHDHSHSPSHDHIHKHDHGTSKVNRSTLLTSGIIGVATGMIPCPTVVVAYLSGVSTGNSYLGVQSVALFALGMFLALLTVILFFNFGGQKIISRLQTKRSFSFKWGYIQGALFLVIGIFTALYH